LKKIEEYYILEKDFLNDFEKLLKEYSIICVDFPQEKIDGFVEEINSFQAKLQRGNKDLLEFKNKAYKFLETYKKSEQTSIKKIENLNKEKEIVLKTLETNNKK
jgi:hypothetical protein